MARAPKVFAARIGFFDTVVAAPSQKAALELWGTERNWFADGTAAPTDDADAVKAAAATPGVVLRRPAGSSDAFSVDAAAAAPPGLKAARPSKGKGRADAKPPKPPADRSTLDAAEAAMREFEHEREASRRDFDQRRAALEAESSVAEGDFRLRERTIRKALDKARAAYAKASGDR